jgi:hypothetical protein
MREAGSDLNLFTRQEIHNATKPNKDSAPEHHARSN